MCIKKLRLFYKFKKRKINFSPAFHRRTKNAICCTKLDLAFISTYTFPIHL